MEKLAEYLVDRKGLTRIACFYQNDGYGQAGLEGIRLALNRRNLELTAKGTYWRNTLAVKSGLLRIRKAKPEAVVMVGAYKPCAEFIKVARRIGLTEAVFCNISFVGAQALHRELGEAGAGCVISQVVTFPWDESVPLVREYQAAMRQYRPEVELGFVSLEGYMVGKLFCLVAGATRGELTRESFIKTVSEVGVFDLGGVTLVYGDDDNQGMDEVFLTAIQDGKIRPLEE